MNYFVRKSGTIHMDVAKYSGGSLKFIMPFHCVPVPSIYRLYVFIGSNISFKSLTTTYDQVYSLLLV